MLPAAVDDSCGDVINDAAQTYDEFDNEFYSDEQFDGASSWDAVSTHWTESEPDCAFMSDPCSTPPASVMPKQLMFDSPAPDLLLKSKAWRLGRAGRASVIHACEKQERQHGHEQQHIMKPTKHELLAQSKAWRLAQASAALVRETSNSNSVTSASNMDVISAADQRAVLLAKSKEWRHARALASGMSSNSDAAVPEHGLKQQQELQCAVEKLEEKLEEKPEEKQEPAQKDEDSQCRLENWEEEEMEELAKVEIELQLDMGLQQKQPVLRRRHHLQEDLRQQ